MEGQANRAHDHEKQETDRDRSARQPVQQEAEKVEDGAGVELGEAFLAGAEPVSNLGHAHLASGAGQDIQQDLEA